MAEITIRLPRLNSKSIRRGRKFGSIKVLGFAGHKRQLCGSPVKRWLCQCDCGNLSIHAQSSLLSGETTSCGCKSRRGIRTPGEFHGLSKHPLYGRWCAMRYRCLVPESDSYANYGGRGIKICRRWEVSFSSFLKDMLPTFKPGMSLDRIDNDGPYSKENCRWATAKEQQNNFRRNRIIKYRGKCRTLSQWAEYFGVNRNRLRARLDKGWSFSEAVATPLFRQRLFAERCANRKLIPNSRFRFSATRDGET